MEYPDQTSNTAPPHPRAAGRIDINDFEDGFMVYDHENDRVHVLNRSAVEVLQLCNGERSAAEIAAALQSSYRLDAPPRREVDEILTQMRQAGLIDAAVPVPATA